MDSDTIPTDRAGRSIQLVRFGMRQTYETRYGTDKTWSLRNTKIMQELLKTRVGA